jgi:hypothetical protein
MFIQYIKEESGGILRNKQKTFLKERIMLLDSMKKVSTIPYPKKIKMNMSIQPAVIPNRCNY